MIVLKTRIAPTQRIQHDLTVLLVLMKSEIEILTGQARGGLGKDQTYAFIDNVLLEGTHGHLALPVLCMYVFKPQLQCLQQHC